MADEIKCTFSKCHRYFKTIEAMKKHKAKDDIHDAYCKKCDADCADDTELLFHQIISPKHICCPICGRDFKSQGGRDRHVELDHLPKQDLDCAGCHMKFDRAAGLMWHIESDECEVIKSSHFRRQRAEKEISKDAWDAATNPTAGTTILPGNAGYQTGPTDLTLLDDERAWVPRDWQGVPRFDPLYEQNGPYVDSAVSESMSALSITKFPPLAAQGIDSAGPARIQSDPAVEQSTHPQHLQNPQTVQRSQNAWSNNESGSQLMGLEVASQQSTNLLNPTADDKSHATWGTRNNQRYLPSESINKPVIPPGTDRFAHVQTVEQINLPSYIQIDKLWDPIQENYACPGRNCGHRFADIDGFKRHLLSDSHVGAQVTCPSCLKKFKTTTGLVAHCESASRKCKIRHAIDYDVVLKEITANILTTDGFLEDGAVKYTAPRIHEW